MRIQTREDCVEGESDRQVVQTAGQPEVDRAESSRTASKADVSHIDFHAQAHYHIPHDHLGEYAMHNWLPAGDAISGDSRAATTSTIATMASGCLMPIIFPNGSR
jgi:hypothetical protein